MRIPSAIRRARARRPPTWKTRCPHEEKSERLQRLQALITRHQRDFNARFAGRTVDVLVEKPGRLPGQLVGRTPYLQTVQIMAAAELIGSVRRVTINNVGTNSLFGALADETSAPALAPAGA